MRILIFFVALVAHGQIFGPPTRFRSVTVATLPSGVSSGYTVQVTDGASAGDCTTGGGSSVAWCRYNGSSWEAIGDGGSGGGGGGTIATQAQAEAGTSNTVYSSPLKVAQWARRCSVQTTSTVLTVAAGASSTVPCVYRIGNVIYSVTAAQTLTITGGSGNGTYYVYVSSLGVVTVQYSSGASLTVSASGLTGSAVTTPGWPTNGHIPLGSGSITTGAWGTPTPAEANHSVFAVGSSTTINAVQAGTGEYTFEAANSLATDDEFIANTPRYAATMGGTTSALTLSTGSSYSSPNANGVCVMGKNTVGNSTLSGGWTTLSVNSATAKKLYKPQGTSDHTLLVAGDLRNNGIYEFCYNTSLDSGSGGWSVDTGGGVGSSTQEVSITRSGEGYGSALADATTYYTGGDIIYTFDSNITRFIVPVTGTITHLYVTVYESSGSASTETATFTLRKNGSDTSLTLTKSTTGTTDAATSATGSVSVAAGDLLGLKMVTPTYATNPTGVRVQFALRITIP